MTGYGRTEHEWDELTAVGSKFLKEQARLQRLTTYTELNAVLAQRSEVRGFDFSRAEDRAAMGELLYRIVERDRPASGVMLSAIVKYLNENDAGSGFYSLAESYGELAKGASKARRDAFWTAEVGRLFAANARRPR